VYLFSTPFISCWSLSALLDNGNEVNGGDDTNEVGGEKRVRSDSPTDPTIISSNDNNDIDNDDEASLLAAAAVAATSSPKAVTPVVVVVAEEGVPTISSTTAISPPPSSSSLSPNGNGNGSVSGVVSAAAVAAVGGGGSSAVGLHPMFRAQSAMDSRASDRPGDWKCTSCHYHNYASRLVDLFVDHLLYMIHHSYN
jgi:hypothetical protein